MKKLILWFVPVVLSIAGLIWISNINISADVGVPPSPGGVIIPGDKSTEVEMTREKVVFDIKVEDKNSPFYREVDSETWIEHYAHVTAEFEMTNISSTDEEMELMFPIPSDYTDLDYFDPVAKISPAINFKVLVNGKEKDFTYDVFKLKGLKAYYGKEDVIGVKFSVKFEANKATDVAVEYDTRPAAEPKSMHRAFVYMMETGSHWKGAIGSGEIIFKFPSDITKTVFRSYNDEFEILQKKLVWNFENLEPDSNHNIRVSYAPILLKIWGEREDYMEEISASGADWTSVSFTSKMFPKGYSANYYSLWEGNPIFLLGDKEPTGEWGKEPTGEWGDDGWIVGLGEAQNPWVLYDFDAVYEVGGMEIKPGILATGYEETSDNRKNFYNLLSRPKKVKLTFSDGSTMELNLEDSKESESSVEFDKVQTSSVRVEVLDTYPDQAGGDEYLGIARMSFDVGNKVGEKQLEDGADEGGDTLTTIKDWINENTQLFIVAVVGGFAVVASVVIIAIKLRRKI